MLGGGGIMRLTGLFTFFILAFALGGGTGVPMGVPGAGASFTPAVTLPPSVLTLGDGLGSAVPATPAASAKAGGRGGGGRRRGFSRVVASRAVVRLFTPCLVALGPAAATAGAEGLGS